MSILGWILKEVVEGVVDTVELTGAIAKDVVKSPIRLVDKAMDCPWENPEDFLADTKKKLDEM